MKKTVLRAAAIAAVLAMVGSASGCYFFPEEEKLLDPPVLKVEDVTYSTYKAVKKTIINKASATGYCVSELQQDCSFTERDGTLKTIYVRAGDTVKKGDLIAEYNTGDLEYEIRTQELKVQQAQAVRRMTVYSLRLRRIHWHSFRTNTIPPSCMRRVTDLSALRSV